MASDDSKGKIIPLGNNTQDSRDKGNKKTGWKRFFEGPIVSGIVAGLVYTILLSIGAFALNLYSIPGSISDIQGDISDIRTEINGLKGDVSNIKKMIMDETNNRVSIDTQIQGQISQLVLTMVMRPTPESQTAITAGYNGWGRPYADASSSNRLEATTLVAYSKSTNVKYSAQQLSDLRLLLPYTSGGQEVYFYGAFDKDGQWNGNCITNVYENDKLTLITDAEYENGKLLRCKQIFAYTLKSGQDVWAFADRVQEDGFSSGVTWLYERTPENQFVKDFTLDEVTVDDVFTGDQFRERIDDRLCAFYHGNNSDGYFNDDTGTAYMVHFFKDGTVRLLYSGNFKNGAFDDDTGNAWYIVKAENTDYMYVKGYFKNGRLQDSEMIESGPPPLSMEDIERYISQREFAFPFELKWAKPNQL